MRSKATWQSREGTSSSCKVSIKTHRPIASVAALSERHAHPRITERPRRPHAPCRGAACRSRRRTYSPYWPPLKWQAPFVIARSGATWRPEREARGSALGVQSREGTHADRTRHCRGADSRARRRTCNLYKPPSKWQTLPNCHCEEAAGRRGNLAVPCWIIGQPRRIRKLLQSLWREHRFFTKKTAAALRSGCRFILFYFVPKIRSPASPRPGTI